VPGKKYRSGYTSGRVKSAEGVIEASTPQISDAATRLHSRLRDALKGRTEEWDSLAVKLYARIM
jgi:hypothetical protein